LNSAASSCSVAVLLAQPACLDDAAAARIQAGERSREALGAQPRALLVFEHLRRLVLRVGEVGDRRIRLVVVAGRLERDLLSGQAHLHLGHLFGLHPQGAGDVADLIRREGLQAGLHAAQVEEELALRLGRGDADEPPVAQDELVHLGLDPVDRERDEAHAALRVEALDRLHQADVAFLDQVGVREPVAEVAARDRHHHAQV
jgi:hypothetical protein